MALTLDIQPGTLSLLRNRVPFRWAMIGANSLRVGQGRGARATLNLGFAAALATGSNFSVVSTNGSVLFNITDTPTGENDISTYQGAFDESAYLLWFGSVFFKAVKTHRLIAPYFDVEMTATDFQLVLICKERESTLNPSFTLSNLPNASTSTASADSDNTLLNHAVLYSLFIEKTYKQGDWVKEFDGVLTSNTEGYAETDVAHVAEKTIAATRRERTPKSLTTAYFVNLPLRRLYVRYTEQSGAPVALGTPVNTAIYTAYHAGIPAQAARDYSFATALTVNNSFLTNLPNDLIVSPTQPNYLTFANPTGEALICKMLVTYKNADGSQVLNQEISNFSGLSSVTLQAFETVTFNISKSVLALPDTCVQFTLRVFNATTGAPVSALRRYFMPMEYAEHERHLQYYNGFGVPECVRVIGSLTQNTEFDRQTTEYTDANNVTQSEQTQASFRQTLIYRTGYISRVLLDALSDAISRNNVFEVTTEGYIPLLITNKKSTPHDSDTLRFTLDIEATPAVDYENFGTIGFNMSGNSDNQNTSVMSVPEQTWRRAWMVKW